MFPINKIMQTFLENTGSYEMDERLISERFSIKDVEFDKEGIKNAGSTLQEQGFEILSGDELNKVDWRRSEKINTDYGTEHGTAFAKVLPVVCVKRLSNETHPVQSSFLSSTDKEVKRYHDEAVNTFKQINSSCVLVEELKTRKGTHYNILGIFVTSDVL